MNTVFKSVLLSGNLKNGKLSYRPIGNELTTKYQFLAVGNVTFKPGTPINSTVTISCNFVTNEKFNPNPILTSYEDTLQVVKLKFSKIEEGSIVYRFTPVWFKINSLSEQLQFTIQDLETSQELKSDMFVAITVYFK